ncbi:MAG: LysM domain-containing protein [Candidatus Curtissbacteria bacterium GW2011_GWA1_41_11]|uniref:LysM domain-containing protein n=1 Tax=Candidatus Curtissbacteria bacterium GW2011_GWA1_41_11 TaxID=1618409 RepID=A0A0G0WMX5_9BACT|nr:MAG: LysM domain-containing protein [Candidatus Curtissbacteria bacterium GW2011_GWA1_41_11]
MPRGRPKKNFLNFKVNWQDSYGTFVLIAIIVIVLGLLVANFFSNRGGDIDSGEQIEQTTEEAMKPTAGAEYTIRKNDSLSKISQEVYGSQYYWPTIAKINKIANPNRILADSKLQLPPKEEIEQTKTVMGEKTYKVLEGDTFFTIAQKVYGDGSKWKILHQANGSRYLPNGNPLVFSDSTIAVPR